MTKLYRTICLLLALCVPTTAAIGFEVYGDISDKWIKLGGPKGPLGKPTSSESDAEGGGRFNSFKNGYIYWHPDYGAHAVYGLIAEKWNSIGRLKSTGYPITDEFGGPDGGRYNEFENRVTITWKKTVGAHVIYGLIRDRFLELGSLAGACGYPTTDEYAVGSTRKVDFEYGSLSWQDGWPAAKGDCARPTAAANPVLNPVKE